MTTSSGMTRSRVCEKCGVDRLIDVFRVSGRGYAKVCRDCESAGKKKSLKDVVEKAVAKAPAPVKLNGHLEVASGFGFRVSRENGQFIVEQDTTEGETATMVFNADELRRLTEWINSTPREI
jgi:hypothetical protein